MKINRHNYETFFIDHIDGALSASDEADLKVFLEQNADLAEELEGIRSIMLEPKTNTYAHKDDLKRVDHTQYGINNRFDYLCIADLESDISFKEREELTSIVSKSKDNEQLHSLYQKLKLTPDKAQSFNNKPHLKRIGIGNISLRTLVRATSIAASVGLFIGIITLIRVSPIVDSAQIAQQEESKPQSQSFQVTTSERLDENTEQSLVQASPKFDITQASTDQLQEYDETIRANEEEGMERVIINSIEPISTIRLNAEGYMANISYSLLNIRTANKTVDETIIPHEQQPLYAGTSRTIGVFEIAQLGVQRLSDFTGANVNLDGDKDSDGTLKKIHFETNLFAVSIPVRKR